MTLTERADRELDFCPFSLLPVLAGEDAFLPPACSDRMFLGAGSSPEEKERIFGEQALAGGRTLFFAGAGFEGVFLAAEGADFGTEGSLETFPFFGETDFETEDFDGTSFFTAGCSLTGADFWEGADVFAVLGAGLAAAAGRSAFLAHFPAGSAFSSWEIKVSRVILL
ncbi:MAG: hypothetical protein IJG60_00955 [Thermoguttaceae bacterium]|nr:hypothetical protein [Thermoguttaceae bacterium]